MPVPRIRISHLSKTFRRTGGSTVTPVDDVDLEVDADEMVVLLGPSGCGKTTLLRCVAGLEKPDRGEIEIDGQLVFSARQNIHVPPEDRRLAMIFQSFALWPHMTVADNVAYPLESRGTPRPEIRRRVADTLALVGIGHLGAQFPGQISGGQQQRVALARALAGNASVVLFDEPLSSVDAKVREQLRIELKRMQRQIRFSALYVTHDQTEAMELGHRVAVIESGKIVALDEPQLLYEFPPNEYVAQFFGVANVWPGTVTESDAAGIRVSTGFGEFLATAARDARPAVGSAVKVVVRPEKFRFVPAGASAPANSWEARVDTRLFAGAHTEYVVSRGETHARVWVHDEGASGAIAEGAPVRLCVDADKVRVFRGEGA